MALASLVLGSNVFLTLAVLKSQKEVPWKSSVLALLFHDINHVDRDEHSTNSGMQTTAGNLYVKLQYCNSDGSVMLGGRRYGVYQNTGMLDTTSTTGTIGCISSFKFKLLSYIATTLLVYCQIQSVIYVKYYALLSIWYGINRRKFNKSGVPFMTLTIQTASVI